MLVYLIFDLSVSLYFCIILGKKFGFEKRSSDIKWEKLSESRFDKRKSKNYLVILIMPFQFRKYDFGHEQCKKKLSVEKQLLLDFDT